MNWCFYSLVILDAPLGETSDVWSAVVPLIAKTSKVIDFLERYCQVQVLFCMY